MRVVVHERIVVEVYVHVDDDEDDDEHKRRHWEMLDVEGNRQCCALQKRVGECAHGYVRMNEDNIVVDGLHDLVLSLMDDAMVDHLVLQ